MSPSSALAGPEGVMSSPLTLAGSLPDEGASQPGIFAYWLPPGRYQRGRVYVGQAGAQGRSKSPTARSIRSELSSKLSWHRCMRRTDKGCREIASGRISRSAVCYDAMTVPIEEFRCAVLEAVPVPVNDVHLFAREQYWINALPRAWGYDSYNERHLLGGTPRAIR